MDGADVVLALEQAGEEIWAVGIDDTYSHMAHQDDEPLGNAFDITWLTVVCIKLKEIKTGQTAAHAHQGFVTQHFRRFVDNARTFPIWPLGRKPGTTPMTSTTFAPQITDRRDPAS